MSIFSYMNDPASMLLMVGIRLLVILTILPVHEFAHAWVAKKMGDNTALMSGRLTLNPFAHLDVFGAVFLFLFGFGWAKPVPINPRNFTNYKKGVGLTAAAGPISNLICAAAAILVYRIVGNIPVAADSNAVTLMVYVMMALYYFASINISLAVFNLIPIPPLDGSKVLGSVLPAKFNFYMYKYQRYIYIGFLVLLFTGLLQVPISWLVNLFYKLINLLFFWVDPLIRAILG